MPEGVSNVFCPLRKCFTFRVILSLGNSSLYWREKQSPAVWAGFSLMLRLTVRGRRPRRRSIDGVLGGGLASGVRSLTVIHISEEQLQAARHICAGTRRASPPVCVPSCVGCGRPGQDTGSSCVSKLLSAGQDQCRRSLLLGLEFIHTMRIPGQSRFPKHSR